MKFIGQLLDAWFQVTLATVIWSAILAYVFKVGRFVWNLIV